MLSKKTLNYIFAIFLILSVSLYIKVEVDSLNYEESYVEFKTEKNLKIKLPKGEYFFFTVNKTSNDLNYKVNKSPNKDYTFDFITSKKKELFKIGGKMKTTINDKVYETIGSFIIDKDCQVSFNFENVDKDVKNLAYHNTANHNLSSIVVFYYLMLLSIVISVITGIVIMIRILRRKNSEV
jgi:hypothetical protein